MAAALAALPQTTPQQLRGSVHDALGRAIAGAVVQLRDAAGASLEQTSTDGRGNFALAALPAGRSLAAAAPGLAPASAALGREPLVLVLPLAVQQTTVNVTAMGVPLPEAQLGNATAAVSGEELERLQPLQAAAGLRLLAGAAVISSGQPGAVTSVFLRGAPSDFTKVLLDGVPIQRLDLGGYDFSNLAPVGMASMQVLRGPDSVIYGSDAAAGVIALRTRRGDEVETPEFDSTTLAGAYATLQQGNQLLGQRGPLDFALRYGYTFTHNQQPGAAFRNHTYGASLGWHVAPGAVARFVLQRSYADTGQPNALLFYGLSEGAFKHQGETYASLSFNQQITPIWSQRVQLTQSQANLFSEVPAAAGLPDGIGDFDGLPVTIQGGNGFSAQGQAILSFGGPFPQVSPSDTLRRDFNWETSIALAPQWSLIEGYRYYDERGLSSNAALSRHNNGVYTVLAGGFGSRLFANGGVASDRNTPFGTSVNPQASLAWFPRLGRSGFWDETRLRASAGTGLKDPALEQEVFSLFQELAGAPGGSALIAQLGVQPLRPQRSRDFDFGLDQYVAGGAGTLSLTWFDQRY
ncbi:MAG: TonB-dependent receptor, partial [Terriglobales bacterium]